MRGRNQFDEGSPMLPQTVPRPERRLAAGFARPFRPNGWQATTVSDHRKW